MFVYFIFDIWLSLPEVDIRTGFNIFFFTPVIITAGWQVSHRTMQGLPPCRFMDNPSARRVAAALLSWLLWLLRDYVSPAND